MADKQCFLMLCKNETEEECLERNLFGDQEWRLPFLKQIKKDDVGFLINLSKNQLIGIFDARAPAQLNIEPDAWNRRFPAQVRVHPLGAVQRVSGAIEKLQGALETFRQMIDTKSETVITKERLVGICSSWPKSVNEKVVSQFTDWGKQFGHAN